MEIQIPRLKPEGERFAGKEPGEVLGLDKDPYVGAVGEIEYDVFVSLVSQELVVQGRVWVPLSIQCTRCAEFCSTTVEDSSFLRAYSISAGTETVDVTEDFREAILLNIPYFTLCRADSNGICPRCGRDTKEMLKGQETRSGDHRWDGLNDLKL